MVHDDLAADDCFPEPEFLEGAAPSPSERTTAMLAHFGGLLLSFVLPAILMITQRDKSPFVRRHAREALNYQITLYFYGFVILIPAAGVFAAFYFGGAHRGFAILSGCVVAIVFTAVLVAIEVFLVVRACMAAAKGREFRYPLAIRLI